jgi:hypothetical protein
LIVFLFFHFFLPFMDFFVPVLFSELILWKSLALYLGLSDLSTSCATAALFTKKRKTIKKWEWERIGIGI